MEMVLLLGVLGALVAVAVTAGQTSKRRQAAKALADLEPVKRLAEEDVTALGVELQDLDIDMAGRELGAGENADYQRALDAYESSKVAAASMTKADDIRHVTEILEDGRYAMACVRARVDGLALPTRRPPCQYGTRCEPTMTLRMSGSAPTRTRSASSWQAGTSRRAPPGGV